MTRTTLYALRDSPSELFRAFANECAHDCTLGIYPSSGGRTGQVSICKQSTVRRYDTTREHDWVGNAGDLDVRLVDAEGIVYKAQTATGIALDTDSIGYRFRVHLIALGERHTKKRDEIIAHILDGDDRYFYATPGDHGIDLPAGRLESAQEWISALADLYNRAHWTRDQRR